MNRNEVGLSFAAAVLRAAFDAGAFDPRWCVIAGVDADRNANATAWSSAGAAGRLRVVGALRGPSLPFVAKTRWTGLFRRPLWGAAQWPHLRRRRRRIGTPTRSRDFN